ncbi:MAG: hypothetical protein AAGK21_13360 [Bacteroidota bacterium]
METDDRPSPREASAGAPPTPRRFGLARLAEAVRRQDWVTVLVEVAVVVLGVVIGFQVNDWGQARADQAKEQVYLRQLSEDLRETLAGAERASERQRDVSRNAASALRAYRSAERPPLDSLYLWMGGGFNFVSPAPVLGTAQGIVSSGDLSLLRDDTLRAALPAYVERRRERRESIQVSIDLYAGAFARLLREVDGLEAALLQIPPSAVDSIARSDATFPYPLGARRTPFPATTADLLANPNVYSALVTASFMSSALVGYHGEIVADATEMLRLVERARGVRLSDAAPADSSASGP